MEEGAAERPKPSIATGSEEEIGAGDQLNKEASEI